MRDALDGFREAMIDLPVSRVWRGYGSALFLELGMLTERHSKSGRALGLDGEFGVMIEWSWRIEDRSSIVCGSWSDEERWQPAFDSLVGKTVLDVSAFGRLPEIHVRLSGDLHVVSFMTAEGQPSWTLFDRRQGKTRWLHSRDGKRVEDDETVPNDP